MKRSEWADKWWQQAKHDLEVAYLLRRKGFYDTCAYMCLLSAEWAVKALWLDVKSSSAPRDTRVDRLAERLGAPTECLLAASTLAADESAMYPSRTERSCGDYTDEDASDRLVKTERMISWIDAQWEQDSDR